MWPSVSVPVQAPGGGRLTVDLRRHAPPAGRALQRHGVREPGARLVAEVMIVCGPGDALALEEVVGVVQEQPGCLVVILGSLATSLGVARK